MEVGVNVSGVLFRRGEIRQWLHLLVGAFLLGVAVQNQSAAQSKSSPPAKSAAQVFVTASAKDGSVETPSTSDLTASIDKQPAQVVSLRSAKDDKLLFAVLVDISKSEAPNAQLEKEVALKLFEALSTEGNQGFLVLFNHRLAVTKVPLQPAEAQAALSGASFGGGTAVYDAITVTCTQMLNPPVNFDSRRKAIVVLSDGDDNSSHVTPGKAEEAAETAGVAIFSLSAGTTGFAGEEFLKRASLDTGGQAFISKNLVQGTAALVDAINGQWALSLLPSQAPDQKLHSLTVKISKKDAHLSAPAKIPLQ